MEELVPESPELGEPQFSEEVPEAPPLALSPYLSPQDRLILKSGGLVRYRAKKYTGKGIPFDDLVSVGTIGLVNAARRFDPSRNVKFATYAIRTIDGEIKRWFRDKGWTIKVPRRKNELYMKVVNDYSRLKAQLGVEPSVEMLAKEAGISEEEASEVMRMHTAYSPPSLDQSYGNGDDEAGSLSNGIGGEDTSITGIAQYADLRQAIALLPDPRMPDIIRLRFFEGKSQLETANMLDLSQMHVSRLESTSLKLLKKLMEEPEPSPRPAQARHVPHVENMNRLPKEGTIMNRQPVHPSPTAAKPVILRGEQQINAAIHVLQLCDNGTPAKISVKTVAAELGTNEHCVHSHMAELTRKKVLEKVGRGTYAPHAKTRVKVANRTSLLCGHVLEPGKDYDLAELARHAVPPAETGGQDSQKDRPHQPDPLPIKPPVLVETHLRVALAIYAQLPLDGQFVKIDIPSIAETAKVSRDLAGSAATRMVSLGIIRRKLRLSPYLGRGPVTLIECDSNLIDLGQAKQESGLTHWTPHLAALIQESKAYDALKSKQDALASQMAALQKELTETTQEMDRFSQTPEGSRSHQAYTLLMEIRNFH